MVVHRAMLRRIYDWCIDAAHKPYALWMLAAVAFAEGCEFSLEHVALAGGVGNLQT